MAKRHLSLKTVPPIEKSTTKWINDFKRVESRFQRTPSVIKLASRMANYLEDPSGKNAYETAFANEQNELELAIIKRKQDLISSRTRKKIRLLETLKVEAEVDKEIEELSSKADTDNQQPATSQVPIAKIIFEGGETLHARYSQGETLNPEERNRMSSGLSGILEVNSDEEDQKVLFNDNIWSKICSNYTKSYRFVPKDLSPGLNEKWKYISKKCIQDGSAFSSRRYFDAIC